MSWNLLTYALPLYYSLKTLALYFPQSYKKYDEMPESDLSESVQKIALRILKEENNQKSDSYERIQELIETLPDSCEEKNIESLLQHRLKVVQYNSEDLPIHMTGTEIDKAEYKGKYYIAINEKFINEEDLPFLIAHEISHILNEDVGDNQEIKTITSLAITIICTSILGFSLLPSLATVLTSNIIVSYITRHKSENAADDFAMKHCSKNELNQACNFFERIKKESENISIYGKIIKNIFHPSTESRIAKIQSYIIQNLEPNIL